MGYHPETLAFSFPPYPRGNRLGESRGITGLLYRLKPYIGFDIWHIDPERPREGQRTDDSCGWFDRTPGPYAEAVKEILCDTTLMHDIKLALDRRRHMPMPYYEGISEPRTDADRAVGYPRLTQADCLALVLMIATQLERTRWWRKRYPAAWWRRPLIRLRDVASEAFDLALNPIDNLSSVEEPDRMVRLIAGALHRRFRPWWRHPRWHVHHWQVSIDAWRTLKRFASGMSAGTAETQSGSGRQPASPAPEGGDAQ